MKLLIFLIISMSLMTSPSRGQEMPSPEVVKHMVILAASPNYNDAKLKAQSASESLKIKLDLRGLVPHSVKGLTLGKTTCLDGPTQEFPCYLRAEPGSFAK